MEVSGGGGEHVLNLAGEVAKHFAHFGSGLVEDDGGDAEGGGDDDLVGFGEDEIGGGAEVGEEGELGGVSHGAEIKVAETELDGRQAAEGEESGEGIWGEGGAEGFDEHGWNDAQELPKEEQDALQKEIDHAMRRGEAEAKRCGAGKGDIPAEVGQLLRPQINWKDALREFITQSCTSKDDSTYRRLNRRFHALDLIMPTTFGENLGHIVACADLSGSMWMGDPSPMRKILSEFVGVVRQVNPEHVDLLYWDTQVTGHEEYKRGDYESIANAMRPRGGGGTDPSCDPVYLKEKGIKPDCIVVFTDGHVFNQWGTNWPAPVLWVIVENPSVMAGVGKTVHVE